jgi:hypothetical protein
MVRPEQMWLSKATRECSYDLRFIRKGRFQRTACIHQLPLQNCYRNINKLKTLDAFPIPKVE